MLVVLSKSPLSNSCGSFLKMFEKVVKTGENVAVLHVQDACIGATLNEYCKKLQVKGIDAYVLKADCEARGLFQKIEPSVRIVDYREWVNLVMKQHSKIVSWT